MKVKLFTHTDLDGLGCAIVAKLAFSDIDIEYCDYDNVNEKIAGYISSLEYDKYELAFITDISVNEDVAKMIDCVYSNRNEFVLLDHHKTALWLNNHRWACVSEYLDEENNTLHSGTALLYFNILDYCIPERHTKHVLLLNAYDFVETVRRYDTWEWKTKYDDVLPKQVNDLMSILGRDSFINNVTTQLIMLREYRLTQQDLNLLKNNQAKIDKYIEKKNQTLIVKNVLGHQAGVVFAKQYHSELGNTLAELHPEVDFIMIINPSQSVSYRTVKDVDLSVIAKMYGGGGHPKSAGSPMIKSVRDKMIQVVIDENMINYNR